MNKPLILKKKELEENLVKLINESEVPAFIILPIIEKINNQLIDLDKEDYLKTKEEYEKSLMEKEAEIDG